MYSRTEYSPALPDRVRRACYGNAQSDKSVDECVESGHARGGRRPLGRRGGRRAGRVEGGPSAQMSGASL